MCKLQVQRPPIGFVGLSSPHPLWRVCGDAGPKIPSGERRAAQVYLRDLYPTTCELTGIEVPKTVRAKSFAKAITDAEANTHPHVFCYFRDKQRMIRDARWKLIHYPAIDRWQLFDLDADPNELQNLSDDSRHAEVLDRLRRLLRSEQRKVGDSVLAS